MREGGRKGAEREGEREGERMKERVINMLLRFLQRWPHIGQHGLGTGRGRTAGKVGRGAKAAAARQGTRPLLYCRGVNFESY